MSVKATLFDVRWKARNSVSFISENLHFIRLWSTKIVVFQGCTYYFGRTKEYVTKVLTGRVGSTAKKKLERLHHRFSKFEVPVVVNLKHIFELFWALYHLIFDLETIGVN